MTNLCLLSLDCPLHASFVYCPVLCFDIACLVLCAPKETGQLGGLDWMNGGIHHEQRHPLGLVIGKFTWTGAKKMTLTDEESVNRLRGRTGMTYPQATPSHAAACLCST